MLPELAEEYLVFVAGGIGRGEAIAGYLEMGAVGVQLGTRFACATESIAHPDFKMAFFRAGYSVAYVPIHAAKRIGKSHIRLLRDGARFFLIIFKIGTLFSPLKIFAPVALGMFILATGWYGWTWWHEHRFTNMSALLYTGSAMVFLMGLISEQITALMYRD